MIDAAKIVRCRFVTVPLPMFLTVHAKMPLPDCGGRGEQPSFKDRIVSLMSEYVYAVNPSSEKTEFCICSLVEYLGYSCDEVINHSNRRLITFVHAEGRAKVADHLSRITRLEGDASLRVECRVMTKGGNLRRFRFVDKVLGLFKGGQKEPIGSGVYYILRVVCTNAVVVSLFLKGLGNRGQHLQQYSQRKGGLK